MQDVRDLVVEDVMTAGGSRRVRASHCDIVVEIAKDRRSVFVVGGNVQQSVTVKQLRLDAKSRTLREAQPDGCKLPGRGARLTAAPGEGVKQSPTFASQEVLSQRQAVVRPAADARRCSLNVARITTDQGAPLSATTRLYIARSLRDFGDGFAAVLLPVYLSALGLGAIEIGIVAALALLGSALCTIAIGIFGNRFNDRTLLLAASALMLVTGPRLRDGG